MKTTRQTVDMGGATVAFDGEEIVSIRPFDAVGSATPQAEEGPYELGIRIGRVTGRAWPTAEDLRALEYAAIPADVTPTMRSLFAAGMAKVAA